MLDSWLGDTRTGTRSDISVTSFARRTRSPPPATAAWSASTTRDLLDHCLSLRRWGRRSESYLFGAGKGEHERFGPLADGTPYDLVFLFDTLGYNFEPSEIGAAYGLVQLEKLDRVQRPAAAQLAAPPRLPRHARQG